MSNRKNYYKKSINALENYIQNNKTIPTEKVWNKLAGKEHYLTSHSLGYLSELKFPDLCKKIYKEIQKSKGKEEK